MSEFTDKTEVAEAAPVVEKVQHEEKKEETKTAEEAAAPAPAASEATKAAAETEPKDAAAAESAATEPTAPAAAAAPATTEASAGAGDFPLSAAAPEFGAGHRSSKGPTSARAAAALAWVEKDKAAMGATKGIGGDTSASASGGAGAAKKREDWSKTESDDEEDAARQKAAAAIVDAQLTNQFESALKINNASELKEEDSHLFVGKDITWRDPKFRDVPSAILEAIEKDLELPTPSPIQDLTIPHTVAGKSVIAQAQTGSGKSFAFAVTLLSRINASQDVMQAMVIAPTRELALQIVSDAIGPLSKRMSPKPVIEMAIAGGDRIARGSKCKAHVVVGTSGKIKDLSSSSKRYLDFKTLKVLVLDEADMMVKSEGFRDDVSGFIAKCRADCQLLFFSATYPEDCEAYCKSLAPQAFLVKVPKNNLMIKHIFQVRMTVPVGGKVQMLKDAYEILGVESSIVFLDTVNEADEVSRMLINEGFTVSTLHGRIESADRDSIMDAFRRGETKFLVTTDVLSRGVDVPAVSVVVNYTVPRSKMNRDSPNLPDSELYLHRIGRTGRYGRRGFAITLIENSQDERDLLAIEQAYSKEERVTVPCESSFEHISALKEAIATRKQFA